jgi:hypothetical protein
MKKIGFIISLLFFISITGFSLNSIKAKIIKVEKARVIQLADSFLTEMPVTVTAYSCPRSAGGIHDYYSEATYWWPNPADPNGPYIRKDGLNNPANFDFHRQAISQFSWVVGTLTSAYLLTGKTIYAETAVKHLKAWFVNTETIMNPNFLYAQAITDRTYKTILPTRNRKNLCFY